MPLVGLSPALAPLLGSWMRRISHMAGDFRHPVRDYVVADVAGCAQNHR